MPLLFRAYSILAVITCTMVSFTETACGSFVDSNFRTKTLGRFTHWGGPKLSGDQPQPISYTPEIVLDNMPGFRVVMERTMADNWMQVLRKSFFKERQLSPTTAD